jgi:hypothetical protein
MAAISKKRHLRMSAALVGDRPDPALDDDSPGLQAKSR